MATGIVKSQGQKTSFWSSARQRIENVGKGLLNNPALSQARKSRAKLQKKLTK